MVGVYPGWCSRVYLPGWCIAFLPTRVVYSPLTYLFFLILPNSPCFSGCKPQKIRRKERLSAQRFLPKDERRRDLSAQRFLPKMEGREVHPGV